MILFKKQITKVLIRQRGCAGWSAPMLFPNPLKTGFLALRPISCIKSTVKSGIVAINSLQGFSTLKNVRLGADDFWEN